MAGHPPKQECDQCSIMQELSEDLALDSYSAPGHVLFLDSLDIAWLFACSAVNNYH